MAPPCSLPPAVFPAILPAHRNMAITLKSRIRLWTALNQTQRRGYRDLSLNRTTPAPRMNRRRRTWSQQRQPHGLRISYHKSLTPAWHEYASRLLHWLDLGISSTLLLRMTSIDYRTTIISSLFLSNYRILNDTLSQFVFGSTNRP